MSDDSIYDEVEIEDMDYDKKRDAYTYPCPCGDIFFIFVDDLKNGEDIANCSSCTLKIKIIYDRDQFVHHDSSDSDNDAEED